MEILSYIETDKQLLTDTTENRTEYSREALDYEQILQSIQRSLRKSVGEVPIIQKATLNHTRRLYKDDVNKNWPSKEKMVVTALLLLWTMIPIGIELRILTNIPEVEKMVNNIERTQPHRIDTLIRMDYGAYYTSLYTIMGSKESRTTITEKERNSEPDDEAVNMVVEFDPTIKRQKSIHGECKTVYENGT
ncbi:19012_t:CDS:2, partial [Gigaspora rosea]